MYCAGQVGADVEGKLVSDKVGPQTVKCLQNIEAILKASGSGLDRILKITIYLHDQADYKEMNEAYAKVFSLISQGVTSHRIISTTSPPLELHC